MVITISARSGDSTPLMYTYNVKFGLHYTNMLYRYTLGVLRSKYSMCAQIHTCIYICSVGTYFKRIHGIYDQDQMHVCYSNSQRSWASWSQPLPMLLRCSSLQHSSSSATEHVVSAGGNQLMNIMYHTNICPALPHMSFWDSVRLYPNQLPDGDLPPSDHSPRAAGSWAMPQESLRNSLGEYFALQIYLNDWVHRLISELTTAAWLWRNR